MFFGFFKKRKKFLLQNKSGFTLVELLLVIAIIGILASVIIVVVTRQRDHARTAAFKEQMRTLVSGITVCLDSGGTIQDPGDNVDRRICSLSTRAGVYLTDNEMNDCDGQGSYIISALPTGVQGVCTLTGGATCIGICNYNGCSFNSNCD